MESSHDEQPKSDLFREELIKRQHAREIVDVAEERIKLVIFSCCGHLYAFYGSDIREILSSCDISWVPGLPEYLPGLINIRGDIESVIDIGQIIGEQKGRAGTGLVAMAVREEFRSAVMIDSIEDVVDIPVGSISPPLATLSGAARDLVCGETEFDGKTVTLLDLGKLSSVISL